MILTYQIVPTVQGFYYDLQRHVIGLTVDRVTDAYTWHDGTPLDLTMNIDWDHSSGESYFVMYKLANETRTKIVAVADGPTGRTWCQRMLYV